MRTITKAMALAAIIGGAGLLGVGANQAFAASESSTQTSIVERIATKFNLKTEDVQAVFNEERVARDAERLEQQSTRLAQLVTDGTITADQKTKIEAKIKEMQADRQANMESMKDKTDAERKAAMDTKRTELETWAKENGIDLTKLKGVLGGPGGKGGHGGPGGGRGFGGPSEAPDASKGATTTAQ